MIAADLMICQTDGVGRTATNPHFVQQGKTLVNLHSIENIESCHILYPVLQSQHLQPLLDPSRASRLRSLSVVRQNFSSLCVAAQQISSGGVSCCVLDHGASSEAPPERWSQAGTLKFSVGWVDRRRGTPIYTL